MNKLTTLLILILCTSCTPPHAPTRKGVDPGLEKYIAAFLLDAGRSGIFPIASQRKLVSVQYGEVPDSAVGICYQYPARYWIVIRPGLDYDAFLMRTLLYHELGHCLLDLPHYYGGTDIMNEMLPYLGENDTKQWDVMVSRMFSRYKEE